MSGTGNIASYYAARAAEYERVYEKPERQGDLARLRSLVTEFARGRRVLEVACGTGYWTQELARTTTAVVATDVVEAVLKIARAKTLPTGRVAFYCVDAFELGGAPGDVDAGFAGFWWSHVRREEVTRFLGGLHRRLGIGARVLMIDNCYVEGSSTAIARTDATGNTYQRRTLDDGTTHEVVKNFPSSREVRGDLENAGARDIELGELTYYWYVTVSYTI
jgi:SAM-dependent methyltransferase